MSDSARPKYEHVGIFGSTMTGKSTILRRFSRASDRDVFIFDPTDAPSDFVDGWRPDARRFFSVMDTGAKTSFHNDATSFLTAVRTAKNADIFIDESDMIFSQSMRENFTLVTRGRHLGNRYFLASQRPRLIAPTVRAQASIIYFFRLGYEDLTASMRDTGFNIKDVPCDLPRKMGEVFTVDTYDGKIHGGYADLLKMHVSAI